jgi:DNA-binding MarR family transcriptional regulator
MRLLDEWRWVVMSRRPSAKAVASTGIEESLQLEDSPKLPTMAEFIDQVRRRHEMDGDLDDLEMLRKETILTLLTFAGRFRTDSEAVHRPMGITWAGFRIMHVVWALGETEPYRIAVFAGVSRASISSALNTLEEAGFIERKRDPDRTDRRLVKIALTPRGHEVMVEGVEVQKKRDLAWLEVLGTEQLRTFHDLLQVLSRQPDPPR